MDSAFLPMGRIGKARGIKGEVLASWEGENAFPQKGPIYLRMPNGEMAVLTIFGAKPFKNRYIVLFDSINDRASAERLNGAVILVNRKDLPPPAENEAYLCDLEGCNVFLPDGRLVGTLDHVEFPANQQVWAIKNQAGKEILFPARPEFITSLEPENNRIVIDPPEGLLEIYA